MRKLLLAGSLFALWEMLRWDLELAGSPSLAPGEGDDEPKTVADLKREFQGRVSENICQVFGRGVQHQLEGRDGEAQQEYEKLRQIPRASGDVFDLASVSETLRHNLRLLKSRRPELH
jgi:hypothetical protein